MDGLRLSECLPRYVRKRAPCEIVLRQSRTGFPPRVCNRPASTSPPTQESVWVRRCAATIPTASRSPCLSRTVESLDHWLLRILLSSVRVQLHQDSQQCTQGTSEQCMEGQFCFGRPCHSSNTSEAAAHH